MFNAHNATLVFMALVVISAIRWDNWGRVNRIMNRRERNRDVFDILEGIKVLALVIAPILWFKDEPELMEGHLVALGFMGYYIVKWILINRKTGVMLDENRM